MIFTSPASAQCPVCIVTVGGGLILAQKLGISEVLVSIWISALNTAIAFFLAPKFKVKLLNNPYLLSILFYLVTLIYLKTSSQLGTNSIFGLNSVILGQTVGLIAMLIANTIDRLIRIKREGKVLFYYQKVIIPLSILAITTLVFKSIFNL